MNKLSYLALLLLSMIWSCGSSEKRSSNTVGEDTIPVQLLSLAQGVSGQNIKTSGVFTTDKETVLSFKNGGVIRSVYVKEGDAIKSGQLLASLDPTEIAAGLAQAKLSEEKALRDYQRATRLYRDSVATLEQLQNAETALQIAKEQMRSANFNQNQTEIRAAASGFVLNRLANDGQVVGPGTPVLQVNTTNGNDWQLKVGLSDQQWSLVKLGDSALIASEILGEEIPAYIHKKSEGIDPASGTFTVMLKLAGDKAHKIGSGMFAHATIKPRNERKVWHIPYDAVLDGDAGAAYVFITEDGKTAKKVQVKVDEVQQEMVLVSAGLEQAEAVIVSGSAYLTDGSPIRVVE
ncbi:efflux RND transporter periplasmic adaptor subunit [Olivibacter sp. SDN3]|uniref:efflux RND transporter periplasmic adaptor subunit n=1 Tax=Olivibacter sp. SDN3 TaxID=2764720 RepID=UPI001650F6A7|nr:efflux RND transporter periplasmic adaptor subunit [Olivibacter sp. SDN3]QNL49855.1 efflux RND transporter periplasmic adaptor subunit [Olivibacter sp. SDN3]